ncbi:MAG: LysR family transcriptional regulator, partial [Burkholderiales bacterium]
MELRDIEYFIAVAERGHVGRAAESLGLSQPALSKSLRRLEASMDTKLVKRTPKGVELTAVGTAYYSHVRRLRLSLDDIAHEVEDLTKGRAGHVQVGVSSPAVDYLLSPAVGSLLNSTPKVTLKVIVGPHDVLMPALRNGQVDLIVSGVVSPVEQGFIDVHLCDDEYFVYASTSHKLAGRKRVTLPDIAAERWAMSSDAPP